MDVLDIIRESENLYKYILEDYTMFIKALENS